ncbi:hypothetical protein [Burkholderia gladioli]|uniref:hypothetical protein n=2 Tax=Burkholderia gladioli TaxID=28095 RepID=UPI0019D041FA|nr:hypothetical protein [Burkholderia gladioli]
MMAKTLQEFMVELRSDVDRFEQAYREKAASNPDHYPLSLPDGQEGLWFEFFTDHVTGGDV